MGSIERFLERRGFEPIGSGCFSTVWARPDSDKVVKVSRRMDGWPEYILWAARHGFMGGLAPRVYSFRLVQHGRSADPEYMTYVALCERLVHTQSAIRPTNGWREEPRPHSYTQALRFQAADWFHQQLGCWGDGSEPPEPFQAILGPDVQRFIHEWKNSRPRNGTDIHGENFMYRADGTLVLNDPFVGGIEGSTASTMRRVRSHNFTSMRLAGAPLRAAA